MTSEHETFMRRAINLAAENASSGKGGPFGCVIVKDGVVIAEGTNRVTTSLDPTAHAEIMAIRSACEALGSFQLTECDMYASCEPCPMCLGAIYWARPARFFYAADQHDAAAAGFDDAHIRGQMRLDPESRTIKAVRLLAAEGKRPFEAWKAHSGKRPY